jgi:hypothetical protein
MSAEQKEGEEERSARGRPFAPGVSGNPAGRPKGSGTLLSILRARLQEIPTGQRKTYAEGVVDVVLRKALEGNTPALKLVWDYIEGAPKQSVDMTQHKSDERTTEELLARLDELRVKSGSNDETE